MKTPPRRLGRGLGAFLDFGLPEEDGSARVERVISAGDATSVLETSAPAAAPKPAPTPAAKPVAVATPPVVATPAPPPTPAPVADDAAFIDDVVADITFPDVEME